MAPDETSTSWLPALTVAARPSTSASTRASSMPPAAEVSELEPTLTTTRATGRSAAGVAVGAMGLAALEPQVGAASAVQQLGARLQVGLPVEQHAPVAVADHHRVTALGAGLDQLVLDTEPGQPVGEVADRLVVGEVGLADPPGELGTDHHEPWPVRCLLATHDEAGVVDRTRAQHDAGHLGHRGGLARLGDECGHGERQLTQPAVGGGADREDLE